MKHHPIERPNAARLRNAIGDLALSLGVTHHVTVTPPPGTSRAILEGLLAEGVKRLNRTFNGRNWHRDSKKALRMTGLVFFEAGWSRQNNHAHILVKPPATATALEFESRAPDIFADIAALRLRRRVTHQELIHVQRIGGSVEDVRRLAGYDTKEFNSNPEAYESWCHIDDLSNFRLRT